jgi:hypothetical protein
MGRMTVVVGVVGLFLSACAFDLAHVTYRAATFQPTQPSTRTLVLSDEVALTDTPCSYSRTLRKTTRWDQIGTITEGDVLRSKDQVLTLECSNVHEAYLVMSGNSLIGFYLPVERGFVPHSPPIALPIER